MLSLNPPVVTPHAFLGRPGPVSARRDLPPNVQNIQVNRVEKASRPIPATFRVNVRGFFGRDIALLDLGEPSVVEICRYMMFTFGDQHLLCSVLVDDLAGPDFAQDRWILWSRTSIASLLATEKA